MSEIKQKALDLLNTLEDLNKGYLTRANELFHDEEHTTVTQFVSKLFGLNQKFFGESLHMEYIHAEEEIVHAFTQILPELREEDPALSEEIAGKAVDVIVRPADEEHDYLSFFFMADDQFADQLLPFLSNDKLLALREDFMTHRDKHFAVPSQQASFEKMEAALKERGVELPQDSFKDRFKKKFGIL